MRVARTKKTAPVAKVVAEKKPSATQVEIFGQHYSVRADGDPEYIQDLARFVDGKMREIAQHAPTVDTIKIAILAALNVSDDFFRYQDRHRDDAERLKTIDERAGGWIRRLEENLDA